MYYQFIDPLFPFIMNLPFSGTVINIKTKKYFLANQHHANYHGFQQLEDALHITMDALFERRSSKLHQLKASLQAELAYRNVVQEANSKVIETQKPFQFVVDSLALTGQVMIRQFTKIPLLDPLKEMNAILTYAEDITKQYSRLKLYQFYLMHYSDSVYATQLFLHHIGIVQYFTQLPTRRELYTLLTMCEYDTAKYIASQLVINPRTVEEYKSRLREKLNSLSLDQLLVILRSPFDTNVVSSAY